jgi:hypothetical protein
VHMFNQSTVLESKYETFGLDLFDNLSVKEDTTFYARSTFS